MGMNLNKKQKIYGGLLILAVGVVFVDRVIIGSDTALPKQASATPTRPTTHDTSSSPILSASFVPVRDQLIGSRLAKTAQQHEVTFTNLRDGFAPSASWIGTPSPVATTATFTAEDFRRKYPLVAVMTMDGKSFAVVGSRRVGVGQTVEGFKLIAVQQRTAVFERNGTRVNMTLNTKP